VYVLVASISHYDSSLTTEDFHRQKLNCEKVENLRKKTKWCSLMRIKFL